ncbi:MAG: peptidoglycan editing factor PgeF [Halanaerobiales bacterium]
MFTWIKTGDLQLLTIPEFEQNGIKAYFTSRIGGVSTGNYSNLNLGLHTNDDKMNVLKNRKKLAYTLGIDHNSFTSADQVHNNHVSIIKKEDAGKGALNYQDSIQGTDALLTKEKNLPLISFYADCVPLYLLDPIEQIIGLAHAGWRGTVKNIAAATVSVMVNELGSKLKNIWAAIGPCISKDNYQVDEKVIARVKSAVTYYKEVIVKQGSGLYLLDLRLLNYQLLRNIGINTDRIIMDNHCTFKQEEYFYSYRRDKGKTGRMCSIIYQ